MAQHVDGDPAEIDRSRTAKSYVLRHNFRVVVEPTGPQWGLMRALTNEETEKACEVARKAILRHVDEVDARCVNDVSTLCKSCQREWEEPHDVWSDGTLTTVCCGAVVAPSESTSN